MKHILSVEPSVFSPMTAEPGVAFFRMLLLAEASRFGIDPTAVSVPYNVTATDGGVDASVPVSDVSDECILKSGLNAFQIKTGKTFKPWEKSLIEKELIASSAKTKGSSKRGAKTKPAKKARPASILAPSVQSCLQQQGRYVLVTFGHALTAGQRSTAKRHILEVLRKHGHKRPSVDVWGQEQLASIVRKYPGLVRQLKGQLEAPFDSYTDWDKHADMKRQLSDSPDLQQRIASLRTILQSKSGKACVSIVGEPGIGKTRLALEALRDDRFQPLVVYVSRPTDFLAHGVLQEMIHTEDIHAIIVLDDCPSDVLRDYLVRVEQHKHRIRLIAIAQASLSASDTEELSASPLDDKSITDIIRKYYDIPETTLTRWVDLCSGSPRVAHVIGQNLRDHPADPLRNTSLDDVWNRYVAGTKNLTEQDRKTVMAILTHFALFTRVGYEKPVDSEGKAVAAMIAKRYPAIGDGIFCQVVDELRKRRILQGERTLYITPKALHIWLWRQWWEVDGKGTDISSLTSELGGNLPTLFGEMFKYAESSPEALSFIRTLVGPNGPFRNEEVVRSDSGANFLSYIAEASPEAVLECLESVLGSKSREDLLLFTDGRRQTLHALEKIAVWSELFERAGRLLMALAEAENEKWANNATGVFTGLFSTARGQFAPTEVPPVDRHILLTEALDSDSPYRRKLGIEGCRVALMTEPAVHIVGKEAQGLSKQAKLWTPEKWGEVFLAYREAWRLLADRAKRWKGADQAAAVEVLIVGCNSLIRMPTVVTECLETLASLLDQGIVASTTVLKLTEEALHYSVKGMPKTLRDSLTALRDKCFDGSYKSRLQRFVGLALLTDHFTKSGKQTDRVEKEITALAQEGVKDPPKLLPELSWLTSKSVSQAGAFGVELGQADKSLQLLPHIIDHTKQGGAAGSLALLGGYLRGLRDGQPDKCELALDAIAIAPDAQGWTTELTWRSGLTERGAARLTRLIEQGILPVDHLSMFCQWTDLTVVTESTFTRWVNMLLQEATPVSGIIALKLVNLRLKSSKGKSPLDDAIAWAVMENRALWDAVGKKQKADLRATEWFGVAQVLIERDPSASERILETILTSLEMLDDWFGFGDGDSDEFLRGLIGRDPDASWKIIKKHLESTDKQRLRVIRLLGGSSFIATGADLWDLIPRQSLWEWIDADVSKRAWLVASFAPKIKEDDGPDAFAIALLNRYGERDDVQSNLFSRFIGGAWWGDESAHFTAEKVKAEKLLARFTKTKNVRNWLRKVVKGLEADIERAKVSEEREP